MISPENPVDAKKPGTAVFEGICPECRGYCVYQDCKLERGFVSFLLLFTCLECGYEFNVVFANGLINPGGERQC